MKPARPGLVGRVDAARLWQVFVDSPDGILSVDHLGCVDSWNPAMTSLTARSADDAVGLPLEDALRATGEDGQAVTPCWLRQHASEKGVVHALAWVSDAGQHRWLALSAAVVEARGGDTFVLVARDVTAVHQAEQAEQDLVATVSHELRAPLAPLMGFLLTLLRPDFDPTPAEREEFYRRMLDQAQRLMRLVEDLLSVGQLDRGAFSVERAPVFVDAVVERVAQMSTSPVGVFSGGPDAVALADPDRLEQVLHNLVGNAEKHSPVGGRVTVSVSTTPGHVEVVVADEGPGIAAPDHERIFERFRQLGAHASVSVGGAGLGLYIARRLVEAMGGRIWVESEVGAGARFHVLLPGNTLVLR